MDSLIALIMLVVQFYFVTDGNFRFKKDEKRRILAAACFLIEHRPDLLDIRQDARLHQAPILMEKGAMPAR